MRWHRGHQTDIRHIVSLLAFPLLLISIGYAIYDQDLSIVGITRKPAYTATPDASMSYTSAKAPSGERTIYDLIITVKNISADAIAGWQIKFDLPSDFSQVTCASSVNCSSNGQTMIINGGSTTGPISAGGSVNFTFSYQTANPDYQLQNIFVIASGGAFKTVSGLTATATRTAGGGLSASNTYKFTVTNTSGGTVKMWRIVGGPWSSSYTIVSMDPRVHYGSNSSSMTVIDTDPLADGVIFEFSAQMNTAALWNLSSVVITGIQ